MNQIPPEREQAYLENAAEAVREATEPVVEDLARLLVADAHLTTQADAQGSQLADEAEQFLAENDLSGNFVKSLEAGLSDTVGDQAERYANYNADAYSSIDPKKRAAFKYLSAKATTPSEQERLRMHYAQDPNSLTIPEQDAKLLESNQEPEEPTEEQ